MLLQLLFLVHSLATTPHLPVVSRSIHRHLASSPGPIYSARWLLSYHSASPSHDLLPRVLRHGIATLESVQALERIWVERLRQGLEKDPLKCNELPKRLFRPRALAPIPSAPGRPFASLDPSILPFLDYLFQQYSPDPSSHRGFPLCGSINAHPRSLPLTRFLLDRGAAPTSNKAFAIELAVRRKDLSLVRLLVERGDAAEGDCVGDRSKRKIGTAKRRKKDDRVRVTSQMRQSHLLADFIPLKLTDPSARLLLVQYAVRVQARDIITYFMDKGAVPDVKTLIALG